MTTPGRPGRKPDPPTIGPAGLPVHDMHELVAADAALCGYRTLAAVVADRGRAWRKSNAAPVDAGSGDDPVVAALGHAADMLVRLQQAARENVPRARQHYEAVLLVAGHMAREAPLSTFRRPRQEREAA